MGLPSLSHVSGGCFGQVKRLKSFVRPFADATSGITRVHYFRGSSPAYFPLLDKLDPALIDFCKKAIQRSERFASEFLKCYMLKDDPATAAKVAKTLNDSRTHLSHGAVIDAQKASELGLNVTYLPPDDDLWQAYWRLYCEMRIALQNPAQKLYEGQQASLLLA